MCTQSCFSARYLYVSINEEDPNLMKTACGALQGPVLGRGVVRSLYELLLEHFADDHILYLLGNALLHNVHNLP